MMSSCASAQTDNNEPAAKPVTEIVSGGARIRGGGMRMDVQIGRPFTQKPMTNGKVTAKANAVVTP
ncbi:MAG: hypothetical protein ABI867_28160 [Kofleriaceae bacterium]